MKDNKVGKITLIVAITLITIATIICLVVFREYIFSETALAWTLCIGLLAFISLGGVILFIGKKK